MGGTMRSPLTATFFAVEITGNTHVLLPVVAACISAQLLTVLLMRRSILTDKVARRGHHLSREYRVDPFTLTRARDVMTTAVKSVPHTMTLHEAAAFLLKPSTNHPSFPVVDGEKRVLGIVDPPAVLRWRRNGRHRKATLGELLKGTKPFVVFPDDYLEGVVEGMSKANVAHIPVVSHEGGPLVGYIGWKDLMNVRTRAHAEEHDRATLFRFRPRPATNGAA